MGDFKNEEETARQLYIYANNTYKDIGNLLQRDEETISRWAKKAKWHEQKEAMSSIGTMRLTITTNLYKKALEKSNDVFTFDEMTKAAAAINAFAPSRPDFDNALKFANEFLIFLSNLPKNDENTNFIEIYSKRVGIFLQQYETQR
jgi:Holliday junction resolvase RusA-like endonuclease